MTLPHDIRFIAHPFFAHARKRWETRDQFTRVSLAATRLQAIIGRVMLGERTKAVEVELVDAVAEMEIYLSAVVNLLDAQSEARSAIQAKLEALTGEVLETKLPDAKK